MVHNNEGLTKTYNRFHDRDERRSGHRPAAELHAAMDRAVLDAYGWTDLNPTCEFILDYEEEEIRRRRFPQAQEAMAIPVARRFPRRGSSPSARPEPGTRRAGKARWARRVTRVSKGYDAEATAR